MIEEKVADIFASQEALDKVEAIGAEIAEASRANQFEQMKIKGEISEKKRKLGEMVSGIRQNIIVEVNGKTYCLFYNPKYYTASIVPALSAKEAETQLAVSKMKASENG